MKVKKQVSVQVSKVETQEVEVEFPLYRYQDVAPDFGHPNDYFQRIEGDGKVWTIHRRSESGYDSEDDSDASYELEIDHEAFAGSSADYMLARGEYACTEEKFLEMVERAREFLDRFPRKEIVVRDSRSLIARLMDYIDNTEDVPLRVEAARWIDRASALLPVIIRNAIPAHAKEARELLQVQPAESKSVAEYESLLERIREQLDAIILPWAGVRRDLIPDAVKQIDVISNQLHAALDSGKGEIPT